MYKKIEANLNSAKLNYMQVNTYLSSFVSLYASLSSEESKN